MIILWIVLGLCCVLLAAALVRTLMTPKKTAVYTAPPADARAESYARKLSRLVAFDTVSVPETNQRDKFLPFHRLLEDLFPLVHAKLEKTELDGNLLFHWKGKSADRPLVLMSHQDVVPAEGEWIHPPFSGEIVEGKVWGRGSCDTKCSVLGFFQAVEELLARGFIPEQDVWLASSCTEEWSGPGGPSLVDELEKRGVHPFLVCDEGGGIITDPVGGIRGNFAMVGVFEKGKADLRFTAKSNGGHASAPGRNTPVARLADFVAEFEHGRVFRKKMLPEVQSLFEQLDNTHKGITPIDRSIIDRCVSLIYDEAREQGFTPTLKSFRSILLRQPEPEARSLALKLELFTDGSLDAFAHETNVDMNNRILSYNIFNLGKQLKTMGLLVITDAMINRVNENWRKEKRTHLIIDQIDDISVLTSGIFSKYRYVTYWSHSNLLDEDNRSWFIQAFYQLARITE